MGEIAEDMIDGSCCQLCGQYFQGHNGEAYTHEFPVVCWDCWSELKKSDKKQYVKSHVNTF